MNTNKIIRISENEAKNLSSIFSQDKSLFFVSIDVMFMQTWEQFAEALGNAFQLPIRNEGYDGTRDWMEDLSWINKNKFVVLLCNYSKLSDIELKKMLIDFFTAITKWWGQDVSQFCVDGIVKSFNVYIVN